jgi:hypothetical protein
MEVFRMDAKVEKLALFRFGLIAPLVIERLPRGELTRRAQEIAARTYDINLVYCDSAYTEDSGFPFSPVQQFGHAMALRAAESRLHHYRG